jgi:hypothetical protein
MFVCNLLVIWKGKINGTSSTKETVHLIFLWRIRNQNSNQVAAAHMTLESRVALPSIRPPPAGGKSDTTGAEMEKSSTRVLWRDTFSLGGKLNSRRLNGCLRALENFAFEARP